MTSPWVPNELVNAQKMYDRITAQVGRLGQAINYEDGTLKLATAGQWYMPPLTFLNLTLAVKTIVRFDAHVNVVAATATAGRYAASLGYNAGTAAPTSPPAGITVFGNLTNINVPGGQFGGSWIHGSVVLDAGQWRLYPIAQRVTGGAATDAIVGTCQISAYSEGPG